MKQCELSQNITENKDPTDKWSRDSIPVHNKELESF